jgi:hypothetical protein
MRPKWAADRQTWQLGTTVTLVLKMLNRSFRNTVTDGKKADTTAAPDPPCTTCISRHAL